MLAAVICAHACPLHRAGEGSVMSDKRLDRIGEAGGTAALCQCPFRAGDAGWVDHPADGRRNLVAAGRRRSGRVLFPCTAVFDPEAAQTPNGAGREAGNLGAFQNRGSDRDLERPLGKLEDSDRKFLRPDRKLDGSVSKFPRPTCDLPRPFDKLEGSVSKFLRPLGDRNHPTCEMNGGLGKRAAFLSEKRVVTLKAT